MKFWKKLRKSEQPKNKSYEHLKSVLQDPFLKAELRFFSYFAEMFKPLLTLQLRDYQLWKKIDLKKSSKYFEDAKINNGLVAVALIKKLKDKDDIPQAELEQFSFI